MSDRTRRQFLAASAAALGLSPLLSACGGGGAVDSTACEGYDALTPEQLAMREQFEYVDDSPRMALNCANCSLYVPAEPTASCGACNLFAGPVAPGGYCTGWISG